MAHSSHVYCGDLLFHNDNYTFYQASSSPEFIQDAVTCLPMSSTPNRVQSSTPWSGIPAYWDAHPPITSTPRSLITPASLSVPRMPLVFSPSPLSVSQVPSLVYPEISPPSQGSGSTPFERQFVGYFSREWNNTNTQISPVVRRNSYPSSFSPTLSNVGGTPFRVDYGPTSQDPIGRISLIDRFISAAADESAITEDDTPLSTFPSQDRSSPLSDLSDLTPLSSPASSDRFGRELDLQSNSSSTSPTVERSKNLKRSSIRYTPNSGRESSPCHSSRSSSRTRDSEYQPAKGTTGCKRKRASRSRDGDGIPTKRKKMGFARASGPTPTDTNSSPETLTRRQLPADIPYHPQFPLLYYHFPVSSYLRLADGTFVLFIGN